mmetsp:Transcript_35367/g.83233  ORF Transcript_35367/g.83233 Transcript_35367/m.83233 type:complete len:159 (-) Transcript_35367:469-945(-)
MCALNGDQYWPMQVTQDRIRTPPSPRSCAHSTDTVDSSRADDVPSMACLLGAASFLFASCFEHRFDINANAEARSPGNASAPDAFDMEASSDLVEANASPDMKFASGVPGEPLRFSTAQDTGKHSAVLRSLRLSLTGAWCWSPDAALAFVNAIVRAAL